MSQSTLVRFRGGKFWAYDVAVGVLLKYVIDRAVDGPAELWLTAAVERWRWETVVNEFGVHLDGNWSDRQVRAVDGLFAAACRDLSVRGPITAAEVETPAWDLLPDEPGRTHDLGPGLRGADRFEPDRAVQVGRGVRFLLAGSLPPLPPRAGTWGLGFGDRPRVFWEAGSLEFERERAARARGTWRAVPPPAGSAAPFLRDPGTPGTLSPTPGAPA